MIIEEIGCLPSVGHPEESGHLVISVVKWDASYSSKNLF